MSKESINEDLKEMLSYHETLSLVCFNLNYGKRYGAMPLDRLSYLLKIEPDRLEKAGRILLRIGMAKIRLSKSGFLMEMTEPENDIVKNTVFDVIFDKMYEYSLIYKNLVHAELSLGAGS